MNYLRNYFYIILLVVFVLGSLGIGPFLTPGTVNIKYDVQGHETVQVFWAGAGGSYTEKRSGKKEIFPAKSDTTTEVDSLFLIDRIRIDPAKRATELSIQSIEIRQYGFLPVVYNAENGWPEVVNSQHVLIKGQGEGGLRVTSLGEDPFFEFQTDGDFSLLRFTNDWLSTLSLALQRQMDLLGLTWSGLLVLMLDSIIVLFFAAFFTLVTGFPGDEWSSNALALILSCLALVVFSVLLAGSMYLLKTPSFLIIHAAAAIGGLTVLKRQSGKSLIECIWGALQFLRVTILAPVDRVLRPKVISIVGGVRLVLLLCVIGLLGYYLIPAALTLPLNFDSHDYRLSRIGYWLQEGHIWQFETNDVRQILMPLNSEAVMLWLTSFFPKGYPLVHLPSYLGGVLCCLAVYAFARLLGMPLGWRLAAVLFWLGIPNSAVQMLTSQTDLFTTGCLVAGLYFLQRGVSLGDRRYYLFSGIGIGLSLGAKNTVLLWGPGLLIFFLFILFYNRKEIRIGALFRGVGIMLLMIIMMGGFIYGQNLVRYDTPLGSKSAVSAIKHQKKQMVRQASGKKREVSKESLYALKLKAMTWQLFEPSSNLPVIRPVSNYFFETIEKDILSFTDHFKSPFVGMFKRATTWFRVSTMSEDYLSFGFLAFAVFICGGIVAASTLVIQGDRTSSYILALFLCVIVYLLFFPAVAGWTAHRYRYAVLVTPFIALVGTYGMYRLSLNRMLRWPILILSFCVILYQGSMSAAIASKTQSHGWNSLKKLDRVNSYVFYWRDMEQLVWDGIDEGDRVGIFLSKGSWKSLFFRTGKGITAKYITSDDSLIVNDSFFEDNNIDVLVTKQLSGVDLQTEVNVVQSGRRTHQLLIPAEEAGLPWFIDDSVNPLQPRKAIGRIRVGNYDSTGFQFDVCNLSAEVRYINIESGREKRYMMTEPQKGCINVNLATAVNDKVKWKIYGPDQELLSKYDPGSIGVRFQLPEDNEKK